MQQILIALHLIITILLIGIVLMQRSEGGALGIGGGSGNLFSSRGVGNALTRATAILAVCFFATSISLAVLASRKGGSAFDSFTPTEQTTPDASTTTPKPPEGGSLLPKLDGQPAAP